MAQTPLGLAQGFNGFCASSSSAQAVEPPGQARWRLCHCFAGAVYLPIDAHALITLCAQALTFISYGASEKGDAFWLDQQGSFMAAIAAQPAYRLLGAKTLGRSDDYLTEKMPPVNENILDGDLAWRQHDGGHTDASNIPHFIQWANARYSAKSNVR